MSSGSSYNPPPPCVSAINALMMCENSTESVNFQFIVPQIDKDLYESEIKLRVKMLMEPVGRTRAHVYFPFENESLHLVATSRQAVDIGDDNDHSERGSVIGCVLFHPDDFDERQSMHTTNNSAVRNTHEETEGAFIKTSSVESEERRYVSKRKRGGRLFQMAVDSGAQRQGLGSELVKRMEAALAARAEPGTIQCVRLHARHHVVAFYARLGYRCVGDPFVEIGIPHQRMEKELH